MKWTREESALNEAIWNLPGFYPCLFITHHVLNELVFSSFVYLFSFLVFVETLASFEWLTESLEFKVKCV